MRRALEEVSTHTTRRVTTRRTPAHGKPGDPGYIPAGEVETITEERQTKVKLHDKVAALTALSKFLGILERRDDQDRERPLFPKEFFAAVVLGDVSKIRGFLPPGEQLESDAEVGPDGE